MSKAANAPTTKDILEAIRAQKAQKAKELEEKKANKKPSTKRINNRYLFSNLEGEAFKQASSKLSNHGLNLLEAIMNVGEVKSHKEWAIELSKVMLENKVESKMASHKIVAFYYPKLVELGLVTKVELGE